MLIWKKCSSRYNLCAGIHELRVNEVKNEMMDDDSSFLATDFGWWWWLQLWVGLILDQEVGSRSDWAAQEGHLVRKHCLTYVQGGTSVSVHRGLRGVFRKEDQYKQDSRTHVTQCPSSFLSDIIFSCYLFIQFNVCSKFLSSNDQSLVCVCHYVIGVSVKNLFPVYVEAFPVQKLMPVGVSCFVHLMSQIAGTPWDLSH